MLFFKKKKNLSWACLWREWPSVQVSIAMWGQIWTFTLTTACHSLTLTCSAWLGSHAPSRLPPASTKPWSASDTSLPTVVGRFSVAPLYVSLLEFLSLCKSPLLSVGRTWDLLLRNRICQCEGMSYLRYTTSLKTVLLADSLQRLSWLVWGDKQPHRERPYG